MTVLAVHNIKGGVGKTTTAVNLAYLAAAQGLPTLLWDLDPQGAASYYLRINPRIAGGVERLLNHRHEAHKAIKASDFNLLDLLPANFSYRRFDLVLADWNKPAKRLRRVFAPLTAAYALLILDCLPGLSLLVENVFKIADALLVPIIPTPLALRTHQQLLEHLQKTAEGPDQILPFFSMVDKRKRLHRDTVLNESARDPQVLRTCIPIASQVERMGEVRAPLPEFAPNCSAASAYRSLWAEITRRIDGLPPSG